MSDKPQVGDKIRILKDRAAGTSEKAGAILTVTECYTLNFETNSNNPIANSWGFLYTHIGVDFELVAAAITTSTKYKLGQKLFNKQNNLPVEIIGIQGGYYTIQDDRGRTTNFDELTLDKHFNVLSHPSTSSTWGFVTFDASGVIGSIDDTTQRIGWNRVGDSAEFNVKINSNACDCGGDKTYGKNSGPEDHSSWCSKFASKKA